MAELFVVQRTTVKSERRVVEGLAGWVLDACRGLRSNIVQTRSPRKQMRLVETLALGGRKQLMLVSCGGERFLVGTGAESVQTIVPVRASQARLRAEAPDTAERN